MINNALVHLVKQNTATNKNENELRTYCKFKFIFQQATTAKFEA
jgi:hypothetical protein